MIDREYELVVLKMREREQEAQRMRLVREARGGMSWGRRLLLALRGSTQVEKRQHSAKQVLEVDGTLTCVENGLVHRPWRDPAR